MSEEASAGEEGRQGQPFIIRQGKADSKDSINIKVFTPPRSMELSPPYDSERMPSRPDPQFSNYDTASWGRGFPLSFWRVILQTASGFENNSLYAEGQEKMGGIISCIQ